MSLTTPSREGDTSRLIGGLSGVQQRLTPHHREKKGCLESAPLGGVGGEQWRAHSGVLSPPECKKIGLWGTLNQVSCEYIQNLLILLPPKLSPHTYLQTSKAHSSRSQLQPHNSIFLFKPSCPLTASRTTACALDTPPPPRAGDTNLTNACVPSRPE